MSDKIFNLFPVTVYKDNIGKVSALQLEFVKQQHYTKRTTGTYGRDQTNILEWEIFKQLKQEILKCIKFFSYEVFKYDVEIYITHSWLNHNPVGSYHNQHIHSNSIFSGVYYINVPMGSPNLMFSSSIRPILEIVPREYNLVNSTSWDIPISCGDLVIFPSNLLHEVPESHQGEDRYSISFNTFIRGEIGVKGSDNYLILH
jgi:uncharacterized protein (TIGR02466 family)